MPVEKQAKPIKIKLSRHDREMDTLAQRINHETAEEDAVEELIETLKRWQKARQGVARGRIGPRSGKEPDSPLGGRGHNVENCVCMTRIGGTGSARTGYDRTYLTGSAGAIRQDMASETGCASAARERSKAGANAGVGAVETTRHL